MEQLTNFGDSRQSAMCAYCAGATTSRDHVPSRVLLDEPYPSNLPVVYACVPCNRAYSKDEEYLACLVECARVRSVDDRRVERPKIRAIFGKRPALASRLAKARQEVGDTVAFAVESERVERVIVKLARGHALFDLNEPQFDEPSTAAFVPLSLLTSEQRRGFETPPAMELWPEVGSRAMQRALITDRAATVDWVEVQAERYRYLASAGPGIIVRMVLSEYVACEVTWRTT